MKAKDFMKHPVLSVDHEMSVKEFVSLMHDKKITGAPVVNDNNELIGLISLTDVIKRSDYVNKELAHAEDSYEIDRSTGLVEVHRYYTDELFEMRIEQLMTPASKIISIEPNADLKKVIEVFLTHSLHRILVMEKGAVLGVISTKDTLKAVLKNYEKGLCEC